MEGVRVRERESPPAAISALNKVPSQLYLGSNSTWESVAREKLFLSEHFKLKLEIKRSAVVLHHDWNCVIFVSLVIVGLGLDESGLGLLPPSGE
jgi:hypothetical protein